MVADGIFDGDRVVIESRHRVREGEVVVALIDNSEVTLKRLERSTSGLRLHPANTDHEIIELEPERVSIQGVLVGQMRRYS